MNNLSDSKIKDFDVIKKDLAKLARTLHKTQTNIFQRLSYMLPPGTFKEVTFSMYKVKCEKVVQLQRTKPEDINITMLNEAVEELNVNSFKLKKLLDDTTNGLVKLTKITA